MNLGRRLLLESRAFRMSQRDYDVTSVLRSTERAPFTRQRPGGTFVVVSGTDRGRQVRLKEQAIVFGSAPSSDLVLSDTTVSRRHAIATLENGDVIVRDQGSTNGSFIQGSRFKEISIGFGAEIKLGRTLLKFLPDEEVVKPVEAATDEFGSLLGRETKMRQLFALLADIAPTTSTILIEGETGTGKELVAEEIHRHSGRAKKPFVVFDCGAVPRELIESALFGHIKGAFTGAVGDRKGAFAEAHGGTLFLDEIGELPLEMQPTLLRVLDKRAVRQVGGNHYEQVDVRIVAATNRDLHDEVARKAFREDLYYRLAVMRVQLPALRDRGADVNLLVDAFIKRLGGGRTLNVRSEDMQRLRAHAWPGNVRELRNVIERACVLTRDEWLNLDDALGERPGGRHAGAGRADRPAVQRGQRAAGRAVRARIHRRAHEAAPRQPVGGGARGADRSQASARADAQVRPVH